MNGMEEGCVVVDTQPRFSLLLRGVLQFSRTVLKVFLPNLLYFISIQFPSSKPYQLHYIVHDRPVLVHTHTHTHTHTSDRYAEVLNQRLINYIVY